MSLRPLRGRYPTIQRGDRHTYAVRYLLWRRPACEELSGGLNLAVGHPAFSAPDASCAPGGLQPGTGALQDQLAFHLG